MRDGEVVIKGEAWVRPAALMRMSILGLGF